jgi:hypothetical protein
VSEEKWTEGSAFINIVGKRVVRRLKVDGKTKRFFRAKYNAGKNITVIRLEFNDENEHDVEVTYEQVDTVKMGAGTVHVLG